MTVVTIPVAAGAADGDVASGGGYNDWPPTSFGFSPDSTRGVVLPRKVRHSTFNFAEVIVACFRFDTSAIPDDAIITSAALRVSKLSGVASESRALSLEWYDPGAAIDGADWVLDVGTTAASIANATWMGWANTGTVDIALTNPAANISKNGFTGLRIGIAGGQPAAGSVNDTNIELATLEHATRAEPTLVVTYRRDHQGAFEIPLALSIAVAGKPTKRAAFELPLAFGVAVAGARVARGAFELPLTFGIDVAGELEGDTGRFELPLTFGIDVAGTATKRAAFELPLSFGIGVAGSRVARGAFELPLTFGIGVAGRETKRGAIALPLTFGIGVAGRLVLPMIGRVAIAGVDVDLLDVFASVTIRHGRQSVDDGPLASSATLSLVNVTREYASTFRVGVELVVELTGGVPRFVGRVTDAELDGDAGTLAIVAISSLAAISTRPVGAGAWPAEAWSDRVERVFTEAGELARLVLELGDDDPLLAERPAEPTTLGAMLEELAETGAAAIANTPAGGVLVQALTARKLGALETLNPDFVELELPFTQADDVTNEIAIAYAGGAVTVEDLASIAEYDRRSDAIATTLADDDDADHRARLELRRRAWPAWALEELNYLRLNAELEVGDRVLLEELPAAAPKPSIVGVLEGWEDRVVADAGELEWSMRLNLSPAILSGAGVSWDEVDPSISWAEADTNWIETEELL